MEVDVATPLARHHRFGALGTYVHLAVTTDLDRAMTLAGSALAEIDRTCSRFRPDSDLSIANSRAGRWTAVDPLLAAAVTVALDAARETDGVVDPCLGRQLLEVGYDDDLAAVLARGDRGARGITPPRPGAWREVLVDPGGALRVPPDVLLDLGATAKAWAADLVAVTLVDALGGSALVSLGGDLRIAGDSVGPWPVVVTENPDGAGDELAPEVIGLETGGLATSSTAVRRWTSGGVVRHHLLDPVTGVPVTPYWRTVSATGPTCVAANVATTAAIVLGPGAETWLTERAVDARLVGDSGAVRRLGHWPQPSGPTDEEA